MSNFSVEQSPPEWVHFVVLLSNEKRTFMTFQESSLASAITVLKQERDL